ncbi:MAG: M1 family metallopeptidase [Candidatus Saccharibacteria bacterium]
MQKDFQLINQFVPENYNLSISLNRIEKKFNGLVIINGLSLLDNKEVILHSKYLNIESVIFDGKKANFSFSNNDELKIVHPDILKGNHVIVIKFNGEITDSMHGLYPCYFEHNGIKKELLATQFESHHAREVFPCIDEPAAKATFDLTLDTELDVVVLSNMPVIKQSVDNNIMTTIFETTPKMSSYLLAWVVGELHKKTAFTKSGVEVNVWSTLAQPKTNLDFAIDIATRTIDFFDEYFGTPYPLTKCDHVALPDFSSGAMENWGLITYREVALLADPNTTSISSKRYIATVITHELSHQWFGNLVTMKWWNDLWLNESFASLVEYTAVDSLEPSWNAWLDFASFESISALRRDSLEGVQSVQTDISHPDEISTLFDGAIVYAKGARLLQMLQYYIGEEAFRKGLKKYFELYAYKNTVANDLWTVFSEVSKKDINSLMKSWISQPGFPVVSISRKNDTVTISQKKLIINGNSADKTIWPIPLNSNHPEIPEILDTKSITINIKKNGPLRLNMGSKVHFVTQYSSDMLSELVELLETNKMSPIDRLQLLNEQTILARAGIISNSELVSLIMAYKDESNESVWDILSLAIGELKKFVENDEVAEVKLKSIVGSLVSSQFKRLGWNTIPSEPEEDTKLRATIISLMLYSEDKNVIEKAISIYKSCSINDLNPEIRSLIISATVRHNSNDKDIDDLIELYKTTSSAELQQDINAGLTSTKDKTIIKKLLLLLKDSSIIRTQNTSRWIIYLIRNKFSRNMAWDWVRQNWGWIKETFGSDKSYDDYPQYIASALSNRIQLKEYRDFFEPLMDDPKLSRVIKMGITEINNRVDIIQKDGPEVIKTILRQ